MTEIERYLEEQHAVITGGSRGIGAAIATSLALRGARLTLISRSADALERHAASLRDQGATVCTAQCDVTKTDAVAEAFDHACAELGEISVLINNAGAAEGAPFGHMTKQLWDEMLSVNLTSVYNCTRPLLPRMVEARKGRIVNVASTAGLRGYKTMAAYCAAKHGVIGLTRALALETAKYGVTVNAVCPGYTDTDLTDASVEKLAGVFGKSNDEARSMIVRTIPRGALISPEEVASAVSWLCSPAAGAVTGVALPIAGGEL